jgi:hypothetical protein
MKAVFFAISVGYGQQSGRFIDHQQVLIFV